MALDFPNAPSDGQEYEGFVFSSATGAWRVRRDPALIPVTYLVIGGGAGGGYALNWQGGGGGAGGYRCNVPGETSGGNSPAEPPMALALGTYSLIVGAGATGVATRYDVAPYGGVSKFASVFALGGGPAATLDYAARYSGGGAVISAAAFREGGGGIPFMNSAGGDAFNSNAQNSAAGGGGGASAAGGTPATSDGCRRCWWCRYCLIHHRLIGYTRWRWGLVGRTIQAEPAGSVAGAMGRPSQLSERRERQTQAGAVVVQPRGLQLSNLALTAVLVLSYFRF